MSPSGIDRPPVSCPMRRQPTTVACVNHQTLQKVVAPCCRKVRVEQVAVVRVVRCGSIFYVAKQPEFFKRVA